jgi:serine/threonine protein kinase
LIFDVVGKEGAVCKVAKADRDSEQSLLREVEILQSLFGVKGAMQILGSPGTVTLREIARPAVMLEKAMGTVYDKHGTLSPLMTVYEMFVALNELHKRSIVHGDLKPHNIFIHGNNSIVIGDFGSSRKATDDDAANDEPATGTLAYQPPEMQASLAGDVYSMTVSAWTVLTGAREPFPGLSGVRLMIAVKRGFCVAHDGPGGGIEGNVWEIIKSGANVKMEERPSCAAILEQLSRLQCTGDD